VTREPYRIGSLAEDIARLEAEKLAEMQEACWFERDANGVPLPGYLERCLAALRASAGASSGFWSRAHCGADAP
jgi:hypothetical protein